MIVPIHAGLRIKRGAHDWALQVPATTKSRRGEWDQIGSYGSLDQAVVRLLTAKSDLLSRDRREVLTLHELLSAIRDGVQLLHGAVAKLTEKEKETP